jgi:hypothetical protein
MSSLMETLVFNISGEVMVKSRQNLDLDQNVESAQNSDSANWLSSSQSWRKSLTVWIHIMDHQKAERVVYRNGIQDLRRFGQSETQKLSSAQPLFCPKTEFSSEVDL